MFDPYYGPKPPETTSSKNTWLRASFLESLDDSMFMCPGVDYINNSNPAAHHTPPPVLAVAKLRGRRGSPFVQRASYMHCVTNSVKKPGSENEQNRHIQLYGFCCRCLFAVVARRACFCCCRCGEQFNVRCIFPLVLSKDEARIVEYFREHLTTASGFEALLLSLRGCALFCCCRCGGRRASFAGQPGGGGGGRACFCVLGF